MFTSRKVKRLQEQLQAVTDENTALHDSNQSLQKQCEMLMEENKKLTKQVKDIRTECDATLDAKELERQELCNQLGELQEKAKKDAATIAHQSYTICRILKENAFLIKTNANLSGKFVPNRGKRIYGKWGKSEDKK